MSQQKNVYPKEYYKNYFLFDQNPRQSSSPSLPLIILFLSLSFSLSSSSNYLPSILSNLKIVEIRQSIDTKCDCTYSAYERFIEVVRRPNTHISTYNPFIKGYLSSLQQQKRPSAYLSRFPHYSNVNVCYSKVSSLSN